MVAQLLMAVREVEVVEVVDLVEAHLPRPIHGDLDLFQGPGRPYRLLEAVDTERAPRPIHAAGLEAHRHQDGEGADDTTMIMTDDAALVAIATTVTLDAEAAEAGQEIGEATVEGLLKTDLPHYSAKNAVKQRARRLRIANRARLDHLAPWRLPSNFEGLQIS